MGGLVEFMNEKISRQTNVVAVLGSSLRLILKFLYNVRLITVIKIVKKKLHN